MANIQTVIMVLNFLPGWQLPLGWKLALVMTLWMQHARSETDSERETVLVCLAGHPELTICLSDLLLSICEGLSPRNANHHGNLAAKANVLLFSCSCDQGIAHVSWPWRPHEDRRTHSKLLTVLTPVVTQ